ncbi:MAG: hypothetical protein CVV52_00640 [Spirochaetae bacterium HGW-Spirochaetae-8]|jgi:L-alanine-DL-glutamate epimerase-like enolase superfamily enzyme|nr:MAG: hypothetical protein CVV52_00640 [Spirochaetae bacterium HGW-Spirochaetae-8]
MERINSTRVIALRTALPKKSHNSQEDACCTIIEIKTDGGLCGYGEVQSGERVPSLVATILELLNPLIVGQPLVNFKIIVANALSAMYVWGRRGLPIGVLGAVEIALVDAYGKLQGLPFHQVLGGAVKERLRVYASGGEIQTEDSIEQEMEGYLRQGFTAVKIRIGNDRRKDKDFVGRVRRIIGDDIDLIIDAGQQYKSNKWPLPLAIEIAKEMLEFSPFWLEDPYNINDIEGWRLFRSSYPGKISGGESMTTFWETAQLINAGIVDILQPDVCVVGGPSEYLKIAHVAAAHGLAIADHTWGSGISVMANLHAQFMIENSFLAEMPTLPHPIREAVLGASPVRDGFVTLPCKPGLGVEISKEVEREFAYTVD